MLQLEKLVNPHRRPSRSLWILAGVLLAGAVSVFALVNVLADERSQTARLFEDMAARGNALSLKSRAEMLGRSEEGWQSLQVDRAFPWMQMLYSLEKLSQRDIAILEFVPDKKSRAVLVRGWAKHERALTRYLDVFESEKLWSSVHLAHKQAQAEEGSEAVSFEIRASLSASTK